MSERMFHISELKREVFYALKSRVINSECFESNLQKAYSSRELSNSIVDKCIEEAVVQFLYLIARNRTKEKEIVFYANSIRNGIHEISLNNSDLRRDGLYGFERMSFFFQEQILLEDGRKRYKIWHYSEVMDADFWIEGICNAIQEQNELEPEKRPNRLRYGSNGGALINWETGTISVRNISNQLSLMLEEQKFIISTLMHGYDVPNSKLSLHKKISVLQAKLDRWNDLNGAKISITSSDFEKVTQLLWPSDIDDVNQNSENAVELILKLKGSDPSLTKKQIRDDYFQDISYRKFLARWEQASEQMPEISVPGRKTI